MPPRRRPLSFMRAPPRTMREQLSWSPTAPPSSGWWFIHGRSQPICKRVGRDRGLRRLKGGGGIHSCRGSLAILTGRAELTLNNATGGKGGAVYAKAATVILRDAASVTFNRACTGGGLFITSRGSSLHAPPSTCVLAYLEFDATASRSGTGVAYIF